MHPPRPQLPDKYEPAALVAHSAPPPGVATRYVTNAYGFEPAEGPDSEVGLFQYWAILRRHSRAIFLASLAGLFLGFSVGIPMKRIYRASTTIEILSMNESFLNMKDSTPVTDPGDYDVSEEETQAKLLSSATLLKRVAAHLEAHPSAASPATPAAAAPIWQTLLQWSPNSAPKSSSALIGRAIGTLKIRNTAHTRLIEATADSPDPKFAADFLNTLSAEFIQQNQESRLASTSNTGDWLSHELTDAREKLLKSEDALQTYARESGLVYTNDTTNVATERLQQYQQSLSAATADRIAKQSRYELAQRAAPDSLADVLNDGALREIQSKINDLNRQIADLSTVFNPEYSKLRRLQAEVQAAQSESATQRTEILNRIQTDYEEAVRKERLLADTYSAQTREVTGLGEKSIQYNILKREVDSNRQLYDTMLQQMKQSSIANAMRASNVRVVDPADPPSLPVSPDFKLNSALGLLGGLVLSSFIVLVRDQMDRTLQLPGHIKQWVDLPELGVIPNALAANKPYYRRYADRAQPALPKRSGSYPLGLASGSSDDALDLVAWQQSPTLLAEAFRSTLTSILFTGDTASAHRVLVFTSGHPAEGKTTAVSNLAIAACEIRLRVLVIDADLRRPRLHQLFNLPNQRGLTNILQEELDDQSLLGLVQQSDLPNLHVLTTGPATSAAAHLLHSPNFASLLARFRKEYDLILIDTPPTLQMTDARIIARQADAVILIARADQTTRDALLAVKERFSEDRIPILGAVLNDWSTDRRARHYYANRSN